MNNSRPTAAEEWKANWTLVLSASIGFSFYSIMVTSMGAFMGPLAREFGWSRTVVSMGTPVAGLINILCSPLVGAFIDRRGTRVLALLGLAAMMLATAAFGFANGSVAQWVGLWVVFALVSLTVTSNTWSSAVASVFATSRGLALGLTLAGTAAAQAITPILATLLIEHYGWRVAYISMAFGWGGLALALCFFFFHAPRDAQTSTKRVDVAHLPGLTVGQAWRDRGLWQIALSTFFMMVLTIGFLIHQIPILIAAGVSAEGAALLAGLGGIAGIFSKMITGVLVDRYRANWVGGVTLGITAFAFALLIDGVRTPAFIVVAVLVNGYAAGTKLQICTYLTTRYAGMRNFGTIFGFMGSLIALGSALGPLVAGVIFDATGGYTPFLVAGTVGCVFCGLLILTLPPYPNWGETNSGDVPEPASRLASR